MNTYLSSFRRSCIALTMLLLATSASAQVGNGYRPDGQQPVMNRKAYTDVYACDKIHVYYKGNVVPQADVATFRDLGYGYGKDRLHVFFEGTIMPQADALTFRITTQTGRRNPSQPDPSSVFPEAAMPGTALSDGYSKDTFTVYYMGHKLQDATASSFKTLGDGYAKDSFNAFYRGQKIEGAMASSFKYIGQEVAQDSFNKYFRGMKVGDE
jgi:hypothetical protein